MKTDGISQTPVVSVTPFGITEEPFLETYLLFDIFGLGSNVSKRRSVT